MNHTVKACLLALLTIPVFSLTLVSCSGNKPTNTTTTPSVENPTASSSTTTTSVTTAENTTTIANSTTTTATTLTSETTAVVESKPIRFDDYPEPEPFDVREQFTYQFSSEDHPGVDFRMQGGCFDGTYGYFAWIPSFSTELGDIAYIVVLDQNGTEVRRSAALNIGHSNSLSLLSDGKTILVSEGNTSAYHLVDKDTLTVKSSHTLKDSFLSIDYCSETNTYALLGSGWGETLTHLDSSLAAGKTVKLEVEAETGPQNFFCTKDVLYSVRYKARNGGYYGYLYLHDWNGKLLNAYALTFYSRKYEPQSVVVVNQGIYVACGTYYNRCKVYKVNLP